MRLENWALIRRETNENTGGLVLPQDYSIVKSHGLGEAYGRNGMMDGETIATSTIKLFTGDKLVTRSGSEYKLGNMHPDYKSFIEAYENGVPILKDWKFQSGVLIGRVFRDKKYEEKDDIVLEDVVSGKVISQDIEKNLCTIQTRGEEKTFYVDWHAISVDMMLDFQFFLSNKETSSLLRYANKLIKPDILGIHKEMLRRF